MNGPDPVASLVLLALDAATLRHQAIANNIANANSAGYVPLKVNFEEQLAFLRPADATRNALAGVRPFIENESVEQQPGSNVAVMLDMEMVKLAQNTVHYQGLLRALGKKMSILSAAVNEGRR
jgi:flagellar basal-body rod protein FlgB